MASSTCFRMCEGVDKGHLFNSVASNGPHDVVEVAGDEGVGNPERHVVDAREMLTDRLKQSRTKCTYQ